VSLIGMGLKIDALPQMRKDLPSAFTAVMDEVPEMAGRLRAGRREEHFYGSAELPNFYRKPFGPGWALVGDAGCHKDPYLALGICDAFRDAEFLAEAIDQGLSGRRPMEEALADYEVRRNEASLETYRLNLEKARFTPPNPQDIQLMRAMANQPEQARRFFLAREGQIPPETFFNPENMASVMANAEPGLTQRAG